MITFQQQMIKRFRLTYKPHIFIEHGVYNVEYMDGEFPRPHKKRYKTREAAFRFAEKIYTTKYNALARIGRLFNHD